MCKLDKNQQKRKKIMLKNRAVWIGKQMQHLKVISFEEAWLAIQKREKSF